MSIMNITLVKTDFATDVKCLFIYGLLNDAFSSSDCTLLDAGRFTKIINWVVFYRKQARPNIK